MNNLWSSNTPKKFWQCSPDLPDEMWEAAYYKAFPVIGLHSHQIKDIDTLVGLTLGEARFGVNHWELSKEKHLYYKIKPYMPRSIINILKKLNSFKVKGDFGLTWPIEDRYVQFQWEVIRQLMIVSKQQSLKFRHFWPEGENFAFVLTHDIETAAGQDFVRVVADFEEKLGFRSSFNFVPDRYPLDYQLMKNLRERGFEIGVHGLKHDGKLFLSKEGFLERAKQINGYLKKFEAVGFRSPLMHRNPEWMQVLEIEYDLSFFDTDPYEPINGGCMSIWPYTIGEFTELPYTLAQDSTLGIVLGETTAELWLKKLNFIEKNFGMALVNTHPDYLIDEEIFSIYSDFLLAVKEKGSFWHALPYKAARWWKIRSSMPFDENSNDFKLGEINLENDYILIK